MEIGDLKSMNEGAVTLLDVLGWKGVWQRNPNAIKDLKTLINDISIRARDMVSEDRYKSANFQFMKNLKIEIKSISDTIALITYGKPEDSLIFQALLSGMLITKSIKLGLPLRGATSWGKMISEDNIFVGPAIDEVASWYESVNWIGVIFTPSALWRISDNLKIKNLLIKQNVNVKSIGLFETYCVNWPNVWKYDGNSDENLRKVFINMGPITPDIGQKLANSLNFYETNKSNYLDFI
ncbi:hypothetical protein H1S01_15455 [Heliobacterium chlorum]|uniref:Uncharacterized protein n=1 Tax=Heliobacterium chlorum TaxID=2698 RepID=A0ABR7T520_HELCL|nr:hypothetical protein [Heliobacterium chlorum]MBC9785882.1 hypothetical protein [Heliobacterium chlorum]